MLTDLYMIRKLSSAVGIIWPKFSDVSTSLPLPMGYPRSPAFLKEICRRSGKMHKTHSCPEGVGMDQGR